jgi:L-alanine-DL-glutamate epimerase-like enolase superfamily enzyme
VFLKLSSICLSWFILSLCKLAFSSNKNEARCTDQELSSSFIEEPTSPDDILGHAAIRAALKPFGVGVATGEHCHNRVVFKQLLQAGSIDVCQIDACRLGGVNEVLSVLLTAKKYYLFPYYYYFQNKANT